MCKVIVGNIKGSRHGPLNNNQPDDNKAILVRAKKSFEINPNYFFKVAVIFC